MDKIEQHYEDNRAYFEWLGVSKEEYLDDHAEGRRLDKLEDRTLYDGHLHDMHVKYNSRQEEYVNELYEHTSSDGAAGIADEIEKIRRMREGLDPYGEDGRNDKDVNQLYP